MVEVECLLNPFLFSPFEVRADIHKTAYVSNKITKPRKTSFNFIPFVQHNILSAGAMDGVYHRIEWGIFNVYAPNLPDSTP